MLWAIPIAAICLYIAVAGLIYGVQRRLLFMPDTNRPVAADVGVKALREVELVTADGLHLLAWFLPPAEGKPVLAYFHGNGGNLADRAPRIRRFAAEGWGMLIPEYRGYGGNPGQPGEEGFALDAQAAMAFLQAQGIAPARTVIYGESIGTGVAVRVASERPARAVVLESPYTSITDIARRRYFYLPVKLLLRDPFDSLSRIGKVHAPILIMQGGQDDIVPPRLGQTLFAAAPEPKEMWTAPQAGHNDLFQFGAAEAVIAFVNRQAP